MIRACIFDLDGVIVDTAKYHFLAWQRLTKELGIPFTEKDNERLKGVSRMRSMEIILELGKVSLSPGEKEKLATRKNKWFVDYINAMNAKEIFPGVKEMISKLRARGMKIALASSSKNAGTVIDRISMKDAFDTIVDGTMIKNTKPDPEIFLLAASRLGIKPEECLVFEDAEAGVAAALAAKMKCIGIGSPEVLCKANKVVKTTADFDLEDLHSL